MCWLHCSPSFYFPPSALHLGLVGAFNIPRPSTIHAQHEIDNNPIACSLVTSGSDPSIIMSYNYQEVVMLKTMTTLHLSRGISDLQTSAPTLKLLLKTLKRLLCGDKMTEDKWNQWEHLLHHLHLHPCLQTLHHLLECGIPQCDMVNGCIQLIAILIHALPCSLIVMSNPRPMRRPCMHQRLNNGSQPYAKNTIVFSLMTHGV